MIDNNDKEFLEYRFNEMKEGIEHLEVAITTLRTDLKNEIIDIDKRVMVLEKFSWQTIAIVSFVIAVVVIIATVYQSFIQ